MTEKDQTTRAVRLGEWLGRCWKGYLRFLDRVFSWLRRAGIPPTLARVFVWALQAVVIITLLYVTFWITLIAIVVFVAGSGLLETDDEAPGWRDGPEGHGYYENGTRIDYGRLFEDDE
ncbi:DUF3742 family protein [Pseudomonas lini]